MSKGFSIKNICMMALFIALLYLGTIIKIPVPGDDYFTLQFLVVLLCGYILGAKLATITVGTYVLGGLIGIPWFATGGGFGYLMKGSFGFLLGFVLTALFVGMASEKVKNLNFWKCIVISLIGMVITYLFGYIYKYVLFNFIIREEFPSLWIIIAGSLALDVPCDLLLVVISGKLGPVLKKVYKMYER